MNIITNKPTAANINMKGSDTDATTIEQLSVRYVTSTSSAASRVGIGRFINLLSVNINKAIKQKASLSICESTLNSKYIPATREFQFEFGTIVSSETICNVSTALVNTV
jgi:hypothetical protein